MELAEIYSRAADYIEKHGWTQGINESGLGEVCLYGALLHSNTYPSANEALKELDKVLGGRYAASAIWNDTPGRTKEEVIAFLREQAIKAGLTAPATHIIEIPEPQPLEVPVTPEAVPVEEPELVPV